MPKGTGPHALRHHYASLLIKYGESVKTVSERLGHTNAAMTLNIYPTCGPTPRSGPGPPSTRRTDRSAGVEAPATEAAQPLPPRAGLIQHAADSVRTAKAAQPAPPQVRRPFAKRIRR
nr:tyrosine-type recombinase/integrase [Streptomyces sp. NBC_00830]